MEISCVLAQHRRGDDNGFDVSEMQLYVQSKMGLRNCQMDIDTPPYGVLAGTENGPIKMLRHNY